MHKPADTTVESTWVYWTWRYTEEEARAVVRAAIEQDRETIPEDVLVGEFDSENVP
jgi:hypothetical protein